MRSALLLSAAMLALGIVAAPSGAFAQAASSTDPSTFNTSGPGQASDTKPTAIPGSGLGRAPAHARHNPGDAAKSDGVGASASLDPIQHTTAGPGQTNSTRYTHRPMPNRAMTTAQARAAGRPGDTTTTGHVPGTTATQSAPGYNTSGAAGASESSPTAPSATLH